MLLEGASYFASVGEHPVCSKQCPDSISFILICHYQPKVHMKNSIFLEILGAPRKKYLHCLKEAFILLLSWSILYITFSKCKVS